MKIIRYEGKEYVTAVSLAAERDVNREAVYMAVRRGTLASVEVLGRRLVPLVAAEAWHPGKGGARPNAGRPRKTPESKQTNE